jgi:hypothetical protein
MILCLKLWLASVKIYNNKNAFLPRKVPQLIANNSFRQIYSKKMKPLPIIPAKAI